MLKSIPEAVGQPRLTCQLEASPRGPTTQDFQSMLELVGSKVSGGEGCYVGQSRRGTVHPATSLAWIVQMLLKPLQIRVARCAAEAAARFTSLQQCFRMASRQEMCFVTANAILQISGTEGLDGTVRSPLSSTED